MPARLTKPHAALFLRPKKVFLFKKRPVAHTDSSLLAHADSSLLVYSTFKDQSIKHNAFLLNCMLYSVFLFIYLFLWSDNEKLANEGIVIGV